MEKRILVVTNRGDIHADVVLTKLKKRGANPFRVNLDEFPAQFALSLTLVGGKWEGAIEETQAGDALDVSTIGAVWLRKAAPFNFLSKSLGLQERAFAEAEMKQVLLGVLYACECHWISHPRAIRTARWKPEQLTRAARFGFEVPKSIITNSPSFARDFNRFADTGTIFKALSSPFLGADKVEAEDRVVSGLPTTILAEDPDDALSSIRELPCFLQRHIPKEFDLRVTVIGDKLFAAKIHSQEDERTSVDFRDFTVEVSYEAAHLPPEVERRCLDFVHSYQLRFGALDLIVTPQGQYVFLENNPVGQFLFVEQLAPTLAMSDALAEDLIAGARAWSRACRC